MEEHQNGFDHESEPVGPAVDGSGNPTDAAPEMGEKAKAPAGREMLIQLQQMIDTITYQAAPVVREVGAKAAELAAIAGSKAGPLAHKAADVTESFGQRVAARSTAMAADLRKPRDEGEPAADATAGEWAEGGNVGEPDSTEPGPGESTDQS